jgi:hypothetical protein
MSTIEFTSQLQGPVIKLPAEWQRWQGHSVRVILQVDEAEVSSATMKNPSPPKPHYSFKAAALDTRGFRFDREEANER